MNDDFQNDYIKEKNYRETWLKKFYKFVPKDLFPGFDQSLPFPQIFLNELDTELPAILNIPIVENPFKNKINPINEEQINNLNNIYSKLENEMVEYESKALYISKLNEETSLIKSNYSLELSKLQLNLDQQKSQVNEYFDEIKNKENMNNELSRKVDDLVTKLNDANESIKNLNELNKNNNDEWRVKNNRLKIDLEVSMESINVLNVENNSLIQKLNNVNDNLIQSRVNLESVSRTEKEKEENILKLTHEKDSILKKMEEDILVLQKTLKEKEKECKTKNEQIINLSEQVENLKADLSNIDKNFTMSRESSSQLLESLRITSIISKIRRSITR